MPSLRVDVRGLGRLADAARERAAAPPTPAAQRLADAYRAALTQTVPQRSGDLLRSIALTHRPDGFVLAAGAPYAVFVLHGVREQYMTWLVGHTVSFVAKDGERVTRRVTFVGLGSDGKRHWYHPGTKPDDFFRAAWEHPAVERVVAELRARGVRVGIAFLY